jgi:N-acetylmuramoyl-L-alanine amidase
MLPITEMFIPVNKFSRPGVKIAKVKGIVMHYTADPGASAVAVAKYFANLRLQDPNDKNARSASATFEVDDVAIVAALPYKPGVVEEAYHVGSKTYTPEALKKFGSYPNNCTVGIEMCLDKNGNITEKTFQNAADLAAFLCKLYGLTEADITTHKAVVGWKDCPLPWVKKPSELDRFKAEVHNRLHPAPVVKPAAKPVSHPVLREGDKGADVKQMQTLLEKKGFDVGTPDGDFGPRTTTALKGFQKKLGVTADGICGPFTWGKLLA